jgi:Domain of unknown function (DUF4296)
MKQNIFFGIYLILVLNVSCKPKPQLIPMSKMALVLAQMHIADAYCGIIYTADSNKNNLRKNTDSLKKYYNLINAKYDISEKDFMYSLTYYNNDYKKIDSLYALVQKALNPAAIDSVKKQESLFKRNLKNNK